MLQDLCTPETNLIQWSNSSLVKHFAFTWDALLAALTPKLGLLEIGAPMKVSPEDRTQNTLEHRATQIVSHRSPFATAGACTKCTRYTWRRPWHRKDGMEIWPFCLGLFLQQAFRLEMKSKGLKGLFKSFYNECLMYWVVHYQTLARQSDQFWQFYTYNHSAPCVANCICLPRNSDLTCCMKNSAACQTTAVCCQERKGKTC